MSFRSFRLTALSNSISRSAAVLFTGMALMVAGCSGDDPQPPLIAVNQPPLAKASALAEVKVGAVVELDASASSDPEKEALKFAWAFVTKPKTSKATLVDGDKATASFAADVEGNYEIAVTVSDPKGGSGRGTVKVKAVGLGQNAAPTAKAKASAEVVKIGTEVALDGAESKDPDGKITSYAWKIAAAPAGSTAKLGDAASATTKISLDKEGVYSFELVVTDDKGAASTPAVVTVTATAATVNSPPVADATAPARVKIGGEVKVDGSKSKDPDVGDTISYEWKLRAPTGSAAKLVDPKSSITTFTADVAGDYEAELVVKDGAGLASAAKVARITAAANGAPVAVAKAAQAQVEVNKPIALDGSESSDPDPGDNVAAYAWRIEAAPQGSADLPAADAAKAKLSYTPTLVGDYRFSLVVTDKDGAKSPAATVAVTVSEHVNLKPNAAFVASAQGRVGGDIALDGATSADPDGRVAAYAWSIAASPDGSAAVITDGTQAKASFRADKIGFYVVRLVVTDDAGAASEPAEHTIEIAEANGAPSIKDQRASANEIELGQEVTVETAGEDPENEPLSFTWAIASRPEGSAAELATPASSSTRFTPDRLGQYTFSIKAKDPAGNLSETKTVTVNVVATDPAPTAVASTSQSLVAVGSVVKLSSLGSRDPQNERITFAWRITGRPAGSTTELSDARAASPSFTPDRVGYYTLELLVNDGKKSSAPANVTVQVTRGNPAPIVVARALAEQVVVGGSVTLDATGSRDPENQPVTLRWQLVAKPTGSAATIAQPTVVKPEVTLDKAGWYDFRLVVSDGVNTSRSELVRVEVVAANAAPTAAPKASAAQVAPGAIVTLDGTDSRDPENATLTYSWRVVSVPDGSTAKLSDATAARPTFTADRAGDFVVELVVSDGRKSSDPQQVTVKAVAP